MLSNPQRLRCFYATPSTSSCRATWFDFDHVTPVFPSVMGENRDKLPPPNLGHVPSVAGSFQQWLHVEIFDEDGIVLRRIRVGEFVFVVAFLVILMMVVSIMRRM